MLIEYLAVDHIVPSPYQARKRFDEASLLKLANSLKQDGLIQPVFCRPLAGHFEIIAGERRVRAARLAGMTVIEARVEEVDDRTARRLCLLENVHRLDLAPIEETSAIVAWLDVCLGDVEGYAELGKDDQARVGKVLGPLAAHEGMLRQEKKPKTEQQYNKFIVPVTTAFTALNRPKTWESFYNNDFLAFRRMHASVKDTAIEHNLSQSQAKTLDTAKRSGGQQAVEAIEAKVEDQGGWHEVSATEMRQVIEPFLPNAPTHLVQATGEIEWYTPREYIEAARAVMGGIDLDPASCDYAQETVQATRYYTLQDNGLVLPWEGTVFMNPPFAHGLVDQFVDRLVTSYLSGTVSQAIFVTDNCTDTAWFHQAALAASALCFTKGRINFYQAIERDSGPLRGQTFFYFGKNVSQFTQTFQAFGLIAFIGKDDA